MGFDDLPELAVKLVENVLRELRSTDKRPVEKLQSPRTIGDAARIAIRVNPCRDVMFEGRDERLELTGQCSSIVHGGATLAAARAPGQNPIS